MFHPDQVTGKSYIMKLNSPNLAITILVAAVGSLIAKPGGGIFERTVEPFIANYCADCHDDAKPKGDIDLTALPSSMADADSAFHWQQMLEQVQAGVMPPVDKDQPTRDERRAVIDWIQGKLLASPHGGPYRAKLLLPQYGNYLDHEKLFSGENVTPPFSPSRIWRKSPYIFAAQRRVSKSVRSVQNPYSYSTSKHGVRDFAYTSEVGASTVETLLLNANAELEWQFANARSAIEAAKKKGNEVHRSIVPFVPFLMEAKEITPEQFEVPIRSVFQRFVARDPSEAELEKYIGFLKGNIAETGDPEGSLRTTLKAISMSPETIYRMEWGLGSEDEHGRRMLGSRELAYALGYALFDEAPHGGGRSGAGLIGKAEQAGKLRTKEDVQVVLQEILQGESYKPIGGQAKDTAPRLMRFFREFFGYGEATEVFKDNQRVREHGLWHDPGRLVKDADNLIKVILREDKEVFERLLTTNEALVFHSGDNQAIVDAYDRQIVDLRTWDEERVSKDIERRKAGILKKPKYQNNPKLVGPAHARIEQLGKNLLVEKQKELERLLESGPVLGSVKGRDLIYTRAYNINFRKWKWPKQQPFQLPAEQRAGIMSHPAWLAAHSLNDETDPIHRGIWVYEKLLAGVIANVPPDVDAQVPKDHHKTLRKRLDVVRAKRCWACHQKINPIGEAFEIFDDFGRYRTQHFFNEEGMIETRASVTVKNGEDKEVQQSFERDEMVEAGKWTARPVNGSGSFDTLGIPELEGEFDNAIEMIHQIAKTDRTRQSIIRHLFRYFMGRNEMLSDSKTLIEADRAYLDSGGSFKAVVISLLSSDSFLYRK